MKLVHERTGAVLAARVERADSFARRLIGLLGRRTLPAGEALCLEPCASVHTLFMRFAIDAVFTDRDHRVVLVARGLRPFRATLPVRGAVRVFELPAGAAADVVRGDLLSLRADAP